MNNSDRREEIARITAELADLREQKQRFERGSFFGTAAIEQEIAAREVVLGELQAMESEQS